MTAPDEPARIPHADRPPARPLCTCVWAYTPNANDPDGPAHERRVVTMPSCKVHGPGAQEAPF